MLPFGNKTMTLYHKRNDGKWTVSTLTDCSMKIQHGRTIETANGVEKIRDTVIVRIPAEKNVMPANGDVLFYGSVGYAIPSNDIEITRLLDAHRGEGFRIASVSDNTSNFRPLAHYAVRGE